MAKILDKVLLLALPASGKSEVRRFLAHHSPEECREQFHMGPTVQLDDFPYVHMMRCIDDELAKLDHERLFFHSPDRPFQDPRDWGTLIHLLNEDYEDLVERRVREPESAALHLMERIDRAGQAAGIPVRIGELSEGVRKTIAPALEEEAAEMLAEKHENYPETLEGKTLVVEFARGGPQGSSMPLDPPFGYAYSLSQLSSALLENATVLYIWVTPEESRRKNDARTDPDDPGSILHHGVPIEVMLNDYGCDDMDHLEEGHPGEIHIQHDELGTVELPMARFDNRVDKTSFIRKDPDDWTNDEVQALRSGLKGALDELIEAV